MVLGLGLTKMKCFEITINGEMICTAGVGDDGVLNTIVSFVKRDDTGGNASSQNNGFENLDVRVSGLANRERGVSERLEWLHRDLQIGDEVLIKITEASACDEPGNKEVTYLACSFCSKKQNEVSKLIAGPAVYVCNECVGDCNDAIANAEPSGSITIVVDQTAEARCSFCGRKPDEVERIVGVPTARVCNECLKICKEILSSDDASS